MAVESALLKLPEKQERAMEQAYNLLIEAANQPEDVVNMLGLLTSRTFQCIMSREGVEEILPTYILNLRANLEMTEN